MLMPQVIYKPHCHYQNFPSLDNEVYLIVIINKTSLRNWNYPITNLITEMGVAHTVGQSWFIIEIVWHNFCFELRLACKSAENILQKLYKTIGWLWTRITTKQPTVYIFFKIIWRWFLGNERRDLSLHFLVIIF